jgi:hypothetical protein
VFLIDRAEPLRASPAHQHSINDLSLSDRI